MSALWAAFAIGAIVGFVLAGVVRAWRDDAPSGYPPDTTRPSLSFYHGGRAGVQVWGKGQR